MLEFNLQKVVRVKTTKSGFKSDDSMKFATKGGSNAIDTEKNLNIWVFNLTDYLGYAYFPGIGRSIDGVVVRHQAFGTMGSAKSPFNKGRTATHEIGHYLNLHHIWGERFADVRRFRLSGRYSESGATQLRDAYFSSHVV